LCILRQKRQEQLANLVLPMKEINELATNLRKTGLANMGK